MNLTALLLLASDQPGPIDNGNDFWFIPAATDYADTHDWVYSIVLWLSIFFFILIVGVMVKFAFDYRRRSNFDPAGHGPTHNVLETVWTVVPLLPPRVCS